MPAAMHAFDLLEKPPGGLPVGITVLFGQDRYLRWLARQAVLELVGGSDDQAEFIHRWERQPDWRDVADALLEKPLFGPPISTGLVEDADKFVKEHRESLEKFATAGYGRLILEVTSWPGNTKLAKIVAKSGLAIDCNLPTRSFGKSAKVDTARLAKWLVARAKNAHGLKLAQDAAWHLIEHSELELGVMDQALAKLALYVEPGKTADAALVQEVVGGWRAKTVWALFDAALDGNAAEALFQLELLLRSGEAPQMLLGAFAPSIRRMAAAARCLEQAEAQGRGISLRQALIDGGTPRFAAASSEARFKRLGPAGARELLARLVQTDLALKGSHSSPDRARLALEKFLIWVARRVSQPALSRT